MNIADIIQDDWVNEPNVGDACLRVWLGLSRCEQHLDHYTFDDLLKLSGTNELPLVSRALLYLSNPRVKILKTCLMYEFNGVYLELPPEEVEHYSRGEGVVHPEYGLPIPESEILICFTVGTGLQSKDVS